MRLPSRMVLLRHRIRGRRWRLDDDFSVTAVVVLDKTMAALGHRDDVRAGASDAEVLTVAVVAAKYFQSHRERALPMLRLGRYLPGPLGVSRCNRRLHRLADWLGLAAVTLGELQAGVEIAREQDVAKAAEIEAWLELVAGTFNVVAADGRVFRAWARLMHGAQDRLIEDALIAATALVHGLTVVTRNLRDFRPFGVATLDPFVARR